MNQSEKLIRNVGTSGYTQKKAGNSPVQYKNRKQQYLAEREKAFVQSRAYLATDFVCGSVQGLTDNFFDFTTVDLRFSDLTAGTVSDRRRTDDWKSVLFRDSWIDYLPIGAKLVTMGSTWLCFNPSNISSASATAVVCRCNTSYNTFDDYGNIVTEPVYVDNANEYGNNDVSPKNLVLPEGNFRITCQLNENTEKLGHNKRIILGTKPYHITGFNDFMQEFSGDRESVRLLSFTVRLDEPTDLDDLTNYVANGKAFHYSAQISAPESAYTNIPVQLYAYFTVNGDIVLPTEDKPQTWIWSVSDPTAAEITPDGLLTLTATKDVTVTATLQQNPNISASAEVKRAAAIGEAVLTIENGIVIATYDDMSAEDEILNVSLQVDVETGVLSADYPDDYTGRTFYLQDEYLYVTGSEEDLLGAVRFTGFLPNDVRQYSSENITAAYFRAGEETEILPFWSFSGANFENYAVEIPGFSPEPGTAPVLNPIQIMTDGKIIVIDSALLPLQGKTVSVYCIRPDKTPLVITAFRGNKNAIAELVLTGY